MHVFVVKPLCTRKYKQRLASFMYTSLLSHRKVLNYQYRKYRLVQTSSVKISFLGNKNAFINVRLIEQLWNYKSPIHQFAQIMNIYGFEYRSILLHYRYNSTCPLQCFCKNRTVLCHPKMDCCIQYNPTELCDMVCILLSFFTMLYLQMHIHMMFMMQSQDY